MSALLARLIDDAALFPPERAPMDEALSTHRAAAAPRPAGRDPLVGRFLCPASRFAELRTHLVPEDLLDLGVIADTGIEELPKTLDAVRAEPRVRPSSVEIALPRDADQARAAAVTIARLPSDVPARIEVRRSPGWRHALDSIAAARGSTVRDPLGSTAHAPVTYTPAHDRDATLGAKYRVGGPLSDEVPGADELAAFISACAERDLAFTCAAGPDHAVRGASRHGLLNVLLATAHAAAGEPERDIRRTLERTDTEGLARDLLTLPEDEARAARRLLIASGTSDIRGTRADLAAAGLIRTPGTGEDMSL